MGAVLLLLAPGASLPATGGGPPGPDSFAGLVPEFVAAWQAIDLPKVDRWVDPQLGLWVLVPLGVTLVPRHFASVSEALSAGADGVGLPDGIGFPDCRPQPGPPPTCQGDGELAPTCRFGTAPPTFLRAFDLELENRGIGAEERLRLQRGRDNLRSAAPSNMFFLSDSSWGAVFYFAHTEAGWRLLVVDTADCGA